MLRFERDWGAPDRGDMRRFNGVVRRARQALRQRRLQTPHYVGACLGREAELEAIGQWYRDPDARLLTLTGESGIGKTHLASEFLKRSRACGRSCVYINLTHLRDASRIPEALFHALDIPFSEATPWQRLLQSIFRERSLLALDDFTGLLPEGAQWVQALLSAAPYLKILVTSPQPLAVPGEQVLPLATLPTPPPELQVRSLDALRAYAGVAVFLNQLGQTDCLREVDPNDIARVCRDLGGHPGKLVEAALQVRHTSWQEFFRHYHLLFGEQGDASPLPNPALKLRRWFRTLRQEEQRVVQCLTAFPESFTREAAAAAMQKPPEQAQGYIDQFQRQKLVQAAADVGTPRYRLAPRVREIIPPLTDEQRRVVLLRLYDYYIQALEAPQRGGRFSVEMRFWCFEERHTLLEVLETLKQQHQWQAINSLLKRLIQSCAFRPPAAIITWSVAYVCSTPELPTTERIETAKSVLLAIIDSGLDEYARPIVELLESVPECALSVGRFWHNLSQGDRARNHYLSAQMQAEQMRNRALIVQAAASLAESEAVMGNLELAERQLQEIEARRLLRHIPPEVLGWYYYVAGYTQFQRGRFRRSQELYWTALKHVPMHPDVLRELSRVAIERGDYLIAHDLASIALETLLLEDAEKHEPSIHALEGCLGDVAAVEGRYDEAFGYHYPCVEFWRSKKQPRWICWTLNRLVEIELLARDAGHPWRLPAEVGANARQLLSEAWQTIEPTYMNLPHKSRTLHNQGWLAWHEGQIDAAEAYLQRALEIRARYGNEYGVARTQEILARVRFSQRRYREAERLFHEAGQIRAQLRVRQYPSIKHRSLAIQRQLNKILRG
ncbi:MAG: tetratricopeptide repeat protein [Fimbriimonadales bacterium]|nr:tetratricopeptide repeat protein [Fimbriimonadales bacterium]